MDWEVINNYMDNDQIRLFESYKIVTKQALLNEMAPPIDMSGGYYEPSTQTLKKTTLSVYHSTEPPIFV